MAIWVVIANSSFADIFSITYEPRCKIEKAHHINFPNGRKHSRDILSDRPGRGFSSIDSTRHGLATMTDPHLHEQEIFGHQLIELLNKSKAKNEFERLVLIAAPQFLGILRQYLPPALTSCIHKEINKDLPDYLSDNEKIDIICKLLELKKPVAGSL